MKKEQRDAAKSAMNEWLKKPNELGKSPYKLECTKEFDLYNMHYYVFRFKTKLFDDWKLGVCGGYVEDSLDHCGHIFSEFEKYHDKTAIEDSIKIVEKIRSYWIKKANQNEIFNRLYKENTNFRTQEEIAVEDINNQFVKTNIRNFIEIGTIDCPSGEIIVADPLAYLPNLKFAPVLNKSVPIDSYHVFVSICKHKEFGIRMCTAKLKINNNETKKYVKANATKDSVICLKDNRSIEGFPVDAGMICFCDKQVAKEYKEFLDDWYMKNPNGNHYDDYFANLFSKSYETLPDYQREGGDFIEWTNPITGNKMIMIASGFGDGFFNCYYGYDNENELTEIIVPMVNPNIFEC